ncbi:MAG: hypothetical protein U5N85_22055 [Arcicella sp.]|nr:hypothetical protein [Arcicella sp.]
MNKQFFKANLSLTIVNFIFFTAIIFFIARIDLLFSSILFLIIAFTIIKNDLIKQPYAVEIDEFNNKIYITTKTLFIFNEVVEAKFDSITFSYKDEIAGRFSKSKKMRIFINQKQIILNQLYGGWEEESLDKISNIFLSNRILSKD